MGESFNMVGVIPYDEYNIMFYNNEYDFSFFPDDILKTGKHLYLKPEEGFVFGTAHSGNNVAIFVGSRIGYYGFSRDFHIPVPLYIKSEIASSTVPMRTFKTMTFYGGVLNSLTGDSLPFPKYDQDDNVSIFRQTKRESYTFQTKQGGCVISVGSCLGDSWGGNIAEIKNQTFLSLTFQEEQSISSLINHYMNVKKLVSIMTNRVDNHFDEIILSPDTTMTNWHLRRIKVYIKDNEGSQTKTHMNILFEDLKESLAKIMELFYLSKEKKPSYSLGFIPQNDSDYGVITEDRVRAISSAIECEIAFDAEINNAQAEALDEICRRVKETVKQYRKETESRPALTDGTYDLINGSISHWSMSAFEKTKWLYYKYKDAITKFNHGMTMIQDEDIHEFIKYRNNITHGSFQIMSQSIQKTAIAMEVLVICSLLHRTGIPIEKVIDLCEMQIGR